MRYSILVLSFIAVILLWLHDLEGCAPAPRRGEYVGIASEEAIIIFDAATRTEQFIRRASFQTKAKDFGFLVPTPSKPTLGEVSSEVFHNLASLTAPRHEWSGRVNRVVVKSSEKNKDKDKASAARGPEILDRQQVAGYDAVVLRADDEEGLRKWLGDNGFDARPVLMEWLGWYVENQWIITAFKVASHGPDSRRWNTSVRMSFETPEPVYPYREPADMRSRGEPRLLRIYLLADARYAGALGRTGTWLARTVWSKRLSKEAAARIESLNSAQDWHLTEFEDHSSPRPGTDEVYFSRALDQSDIERIHYYDKTEYVPEKSVSASAGFSWSIGLGIVATAVLACAVFFAIRWYRTRFA